MERTGKFKSYNSITNEITLSVNGGTIPEELERLRTAPLLDIKVAPHREKRSLNANAYFHVLVGKIAEATNSTDTEVKNRIIRNCGAWMIINGARPTYAVVPELVEEMLNMDGMHWVVTDRTPTEDGRIKMALKRGTHTYNSKEMARVIDAAVQEAQGLGIEVLPPAELERMYAMVDKK